MPAAVIVATARSPIGRAFKGSLRDVRPDDLAATIVRAALDKIPQLDPTEIGKNVPVEVPLVGDAGPILSALTRALAPRSCGGWTRWTKSGGGTPSS